MRMRKKKHTDDRLLACGELFYDAPTVLRGKWNTLSGGRPLFLEIGCGKGTFVCETARRHPENFYIAIEKVRDVLVMAIEKVKEAGLSNVLFSDIDAERLTDVFADGELAGIYLNFSDPWPKKKHAGRRFVNPDNLKEVYRVLKTGGLFRIATDHPVYKRHVLRTMHQDAGFIWTAKCGEDWKREPADWVRTKYQQKAVREGRRPVFFDYRKI